MIEVIFQLSANGLIAGALYMLFGFGLAMEYRITRFFNFSAAAVFAAGGYGCWSIIKLFKLESADIFSWPFCLAVAGGVLTAVVLGVLLEFFFIRLCGVVAQPHWLICWRHWPFLSLSKTAFR